MNEFMRRALTEADQGMRAGDGGPFGAVVVKDGQIVGIGHNQVLKDCDSTAHAEVVAIRQAERRLGTHDLSGCEIFATCYPCPMCLAAILWSRIGTVYYGSTAEQAASIGFDDQTFYDAVRDPEASAQLELIRIEHDAFAQLFQDWQSMENKTIY